MSLSAHFHSIFFKRNAPQSSLLPHSESLFENPSSPFQRHQRHEKSGGDRNERSEKQQQQQQQSGQRRSPSFLLLDNGSSGIRSDDLDGDDLFFAASS